MAERENAAFVQASIPKYDGYYDHWAILMENLLRSKEYWEIVQNGIPSLPANASQEMQKTVHEAKLKDLKAKNYLFQALDRKVLETILKMDTAKDIWDSLKQKFQGSSKVKRAQLQTLRREFEVLGMKEDETVNDYFARTLAIASKMKAHGEVLTDTIIVEKIMRSMTPKFNYVMCSITLSTNVETLTVDELQSAILVEEQ